MRKVWAYLSNAALSKEQENQILAEGRAFVNSWTAHENPLKADFTIHAHRILLVTVDEDLHNASGCSIDKLLRFIKDTEKKHGLDLLNRLLVAIDGTSEMSVFHSSKVPELIENGTLTAESLVYNTAVSNESELAQWLQPLHTTWLKKYLRTV